MDATLVEQIEAAIDALTLAQTEAKVAKQTMRKQRVSLGLTCDQPDDDIAQLMGRARYMKRLAAHREQARG
jgi:hypothetical protein